MIHKVAWMLAIIAAPMRVPAQAVRVADGKVYYERAPGELARPLTTTGRDTAAVLSPDGRIAVFVRRTPGQPIKTGSGSAEATELWSVRVDGTGARRLVASRPATNMEAVLAGFTSPQFSPDSRRVYFLSEAWATSGAVHVADLGTGTERFVCPGNSLEVILRGRYAGHLIVAQHRYFLTAGSYDWIWLFAPDGREVGPIADAANPDADDRLAEFRRENVPR